MYQPQKAHLSVDLDRPIFEYSGYVRSDTNLLTKPIHFGGSSLTNGVISVDNDSSESIFLKIQRFDYEIETIEFEGSSVYSLGKGDENSKISQILSIYVNKYEGKFSEGSDLKAVSFKVRQGEIKQDGTTAYPDKYFFVGPFFLDSQWINPQNYAIQFKGKGAEDLTLDALMSLDDPGNKKISFPDYSEIDTKKAIEVSENSKINFFTDLMGRSLLFRLNYKSGTLNNLDFDIALLQ